MYITKFPFGFIYYWSKNLLPYWYEFLFPANVKDGFERFCFNFEVIFGGDSNKIDVLLLQFYKFKISFPVLIVFGYFTNCTFCRDSLEHTNHICKRIWFKVYIDIYVSVFIKIVFRILHAFTLYYFNTWIYVLSRTIIKQ